MKRRAIWLLVAGLTFVAGVAAAKLLFYVPNVHGSSYQNVNVQKTASSRFAEPEIPFVAFCELVRNPNAYDQKVIRTEAILYWGVDDLDLWSSECEKKDSYVFGECFSTTLNTCEEVKKAIMKSHGGKKVSWVFSYTTINVVGKFSAYVQGGRRHRLDMLEIKDAKAVDNGR